MAEPIIENIPVDNGIVESPIEDTQLEDALNKRFSSQNEEDPKKDETNKPIEEKKESKPEPIKEEAKGKQEKQVEIEKPILSSDEVEKLDPKSKGAWGAIKNANKRAHSIIQERDSEITNLKAAIAQKGSTSTKEVEELKSKVSELEKYRAMVEIEADPEFISKYDKPIESLGSEIKDFLKLRNITEDQLKTLNINDTKMMSQIIGIIDRDEGEINASELRGKIREYLDLSQKRSKTINEQKNNYKETLEKKKQENFSKSAESEGRMIKHLEAKSSEKDKDGNPLIPFLNKMQPKENASQGEIQQVENHNHLVDVMTKKLQEVNKMNEPEQRAEINIAAVASHYLMAQIKSLNSELKKYKDQVQKISSVTSETPTRKPNNPTGVNGRNGEIPDTATAMESFFSRSR